MDDGQQQNWLILAQAKGLGPRKLLTLLETWPSAESILDHINDLPLSTNIKQQLHSPDQSGIDSALRWRSDSNQHHLIPLHSPHYPNTLATLPDPPIILYVLGDPTLLKQPQLAIVGSRRASPFGLKQSHQFAAALSQHGFCITSGLAIGIDGAAHQGALSAQGHTIAVLGSGLNHLYPQRHIALAETISRHGALISEFPLSMPPLPENFPRRNRIISGLSLGTLVIEASLKSGSLITAQLANEQGREVFAIPGAIRHPQSAGVHHLIQQGAKLVTCTADILEEITLTAPPKENPKQQFVSQKLDSTLFDLLECVDFAATRLDDIHKISSLSLNELAPKLLRLEILGYIKKVTGGYIRVS